LEELGIIDRDLVIERWNAAKYSRYVPSLFRESTFGKFLRKYHLELFFS
jgi:hypothetical protein